MKKPKQKKEPGSLERQLLWNLRTNVNPQTISYYFVIVNDSREIAEIKERIFGKFHSIDELKEVPSEGNIGGLPYLIMRFNTFNKQVGISEIVSAYNGPVKKDPRLYEREEPNGFDNLVTYVESKLEKLVE